MTRENTYIFIQVAIPAQKLFVSGQVCVSTRTCYTCGHVRVIAPHRASEARCDLRSLHTFLSSCHSGSGL